MTLGNWKENFNFDIITVEQFCKFRKCLSSKLKNFLLKFFETLRVHARFGVILYFGYIFRLLKCDLMFKINFLVNALTKNQMFFHKLMSC